jgi:site-specific DNA-methyltransferase (adenine-specific)
LSLKNPDLKFQLFKGDCIDVMTNLPEGKIDLVFTSPPYEDLRNYHNSNNFQGDDYVRFLLDVGREVFRVLRPGGNFIINIQSKINQKSQQRSLSVYKIIIKMVEELGFSFIEPYIWAKTSSTPYRSNLRCYNAYEYCLWFSKGVKNVTFNPDNIRKPYAESTIKRYEYKTNRNFGNITPDGKRIYAAEHQERRKKIEINAKGALHPNVLSLPQCYGLNKNHPAKMQPKVAEFFIKAGSNPGDIILDPFMGSGTTLLEGFKYGVNGLGIELADTYINNTYNELIHLTDVAKYDIIFDNPYTFKI